MALFFQQFLSDIKFIVGTQKKKDRNQNDMVLEVIWFLNARARNILIEFFQTLPSRPFLKH